MKTTITCTSKFRGGCGVQHRTEEAAERHCRRLNNLHVGPCRYRLARGPNSPYCPACDGGAWLDYTPTEARGR